MTTVALAWGIMLFVSMNNLLRPFDNFMDVFVWLLYLLVLSLVVLWPKSGKDSRAEHAHHANWAERVDFHRRRQPL
jgi:hypothetical protein